MWTFIGQFLDRYGRTRTMGIIILGPLLSDFLTFVVFFFSDILPGKYWFLVISSVMEGIMGGKLTGHCIVFMTKLSFSSFICRRCGDFVHA